MSLSTPDSDTIISTAAAVEVVDIDSTASVGSSVKEEGLVSRDPGRADVAAAERTDSGKGMESHKIGHEINFTEEMGASEVNVEVRVVRSYPCLLSRSSLTS